MTVDDLPDAASSCCSSGQSCVFTKALLARAAHCPLATRRSAGEVDLMTCGSPVARTNCATLSALLRERATFRLRLPRPPSPLVHAKAMQLQCGGLQALQRVLDAPAPDVHALIGLAHARHDSLLALPWQALIDDLATWQPRRRRPAANP